MKFNTVEPQWLKHLWDHGTLFETWVIIAPGQEASGINLGSYWCSSIQKWYVECTHQNRLIEVILMITHNIQFYDKIRQFHRTKIPRYLFSRAVGRVS